MILFVLADTRSVHGETTEEVPEIVVYGSRLDRYLPARTEISADELEQLSKSDFSQVLDLSPGMNVRIAGRGEPRVDVRGFDQRATLFTLDGVPIYDPYNGIVNVDLFPLEALQRVELTRGAASSLFGPNGMAGAVHMRTPRGRARLSGRLATVWRDSNFWDVRGSAALQRGGFSLLAGGRYLTSDGYRLSSDFEKRPPTRRRLEDGGLRLNSDREQGSVFASAGYDVTPSRRFRVTVLESVAEFGVPPSTTDFDPVLRRTDREELTHVHVGAEGDPFGDVRLSGAAWYSEYDIRESTFEEPDFRTRLLTATARSREYGGLGNLDVPLGDADWLAFAVQVRQGDADVGDSVSGTAGRPEVTTTSFAVENLYDVTPWLALLAGVSFDVQTGGGRGTEWEPNPQAGLSLDGGRLGVGRLSVSRKTRFPTLRELFDPLQGNPDLEAEKSLTYEAGYRWSMERLRIDFGLFRSDVDDLIEVSGRQSDPQVALNLNEAVLQGIELAIDCSPIPEVDLHANYTFLDAEAENPRDGEFDDVNHRPEHRFNGVLQFFLPFASRLRLEGVYTSEQIDRFGRDVKVDPFGLFNVQLSTTVADLVEVAIGVNNLLDADYEEKFGAPRPGRWFYVGVRGRYERREA